MAKKAKKPKIVALIPARGGSKSIPYKNIKPIGGKPLVYWTLKAAKKSSHIDEVYLSTEDSKIKEVAESFNLGVKVIGRPKKFATDSASTESVMLHFAQKTDFDVLVTLQATSPLTGTKDLDSAIQKFISEGKDSMLTGVRTKRFFWNDKGIPLNYNHFKRPLRQSFKGSMMENGAFYISKKDILKKYKNRLGGRVGIYEMPEDHAVELDEPNDWHIVEDILQKREGRDLKNKLKNIKIIFSDFDGVWTDNRVYTDAGGNETLINHKGDSMGLSEFRKKIDLPMVIVSGEKNNIVKKRCKKLKLQNITGTENKEGVISRELLRRGLSWGNACYIGNDLNDIECTKKAALSFCPQDAHKEAKKYADYIVSKPGGKGAVREILDIFLKNYGI